jgi:hypothetical protein
LCDNVVIGDNNKCCAASSCSSNSIKHDTAYLWYAIRNDCIFDSNRVEYSLYRISPRIRSQGWLQMTIHCMLEIRLMLHVTMSSSPITINTATSSCGSNGISYGSAYLCYTIRNNHNNNSIRVEYSVNGTAYQSSNSFGILAPGAILYMSETLLTQVA